MHMDLMEGDLLSLGKNQNNLINLINRRYAMIPYDQDDEYALIDAKYHLSIQSTFIVPGEYDSTARLAYSICRA